MYVVAAIEKESERAIEREGERERERASAREALVLRATSELSSFIPTYATVQQQGESRGAVKASKPREREREREREIDRRLRSYG